MTKMVIHHKLSHSMIAAAILRKTDGFSRFIEIKRQEALHTLTGAL
jgi:hypothetical protein